MSLFDRIIGSWIIDLILVGYILTAWLVFIPQYSHSDAGGAILLAYGGGFLAGARMMHRIYSKRPTVRIVGKSE